MIARASHTSYAQLSSPSVDEVSTASISATAQPSYPLAI